ncbi:Solute carrier family 25 member 35 [Armadillidium nasatum]|uniref:Solute carrier family 25 member 35 n=1 Tax=Armadillidium nasatum TaxID=96803 RepID=A0A5N5TBG1_9CRUS|nr:Solute carrier family 25 member 35 [Armadillidium nasatum]
MEFVVGATAACGAVIISNPCDVLKTRMQLQGELKARGQYVIVYRNIFHAFYAVVKVDGILALQKGLLPAMSYQVVLNGTRFGLYQTIIDSGIITKENGSVSTLGCILAGAFAGIAGGFLGSPLSLIKTQLQARAHESIAVGYQHHHKGAFIALKSIYIKNGIRGLWRGSSTAVPRAGVGSASQLFVYSKSKDWLDDLNASSIFL